MDPLTLLIIGAIGYAIFHESDEDRRRRELAEAEYRAQRERDRELKARLDKEHEERHRQRLEAQRQLEEQRTRKFASARECFSEQYVSFTRISTYLSCPQRFKLIYLDRLRPKDDLLRFGKGRLVHEMIEAYLRPMVGQRIEHLSWRALLKHADLGAMRELPFMWKYRTKQELIAKLRLRDLAVHWCRTFPKDVTVIGVEHELSFVLSGTKVYGIVDAIVQHGNGQYEIIDFKTGSRMPVREQLELYCIPFAQRPTSHPMRLRYMRLDKQYHHSWTVTQEDLVSIARRMSTIIEVMLQDTLFRPFCGDHCKTCGVNEHCRFKEDSRSVTSIGGQLTFTPIRMKKPNVTPFEHREDAVRPPSVEGRPITGASFDYVKGKREYKCEETGQIIPVGENHFADHKGMRFSVEGYLLRFPKRKAEALRKMGAMLTRSR